MPRTAKDPPGKTAQQRRVPRKKTSTSMTGAKYSIKSMWSLIKSDPYVLLNTLRTEKLHKHLITLLHFVMRNSIIPPFGSLYFVNPAHRAWSHFQKPQQCNATVSAINWFLSVPSWISWINSLLLTNNCCKKDCTSNLKKRDNSDGNWSEMW